MPLRSMLLRYWSFSPGIHSSKDRSDFGPLKRKEGKLKKGMLPNRTPSSEGFGSFLSLHVCSEAQTTKRRLSAVLRLHKLKDHRLQLQSISWIFIANWLIFQRYPAVPAVVCSPAVVWSLTTCPRPPKSCLSAWACLALTVMNRSGAYVGSPLYALLLVTARVTSLSKA